MFKEILTQEQAEALEDLREHEGVVPLLMKVEQQIQAMEKDVMSTMLDGDVDDERVLIYRKKAVDGARKVQNTLRELLANKK